MKCNIWRLAVRYDIYIYIYVIGRLKVKNIQILSSHLQPDQPSDIAFRFFYQNSFPFSAHLIFLYSTTPIMSVYMHKL